MTSEGQIRIAFGPLETSSERVVSRLPGQKRTPEASVTAEKRGQALLQRARKGSLAFSGMFAAVSAEVGLSGPAVPVEELRRLMVAEGVRPEDNEFSRGIIEMREE